MLADLVGGLARIGDWELLVVSIARLPEGAGGIIPERIQAAGAQVVCLQAGSSKDLRVLPRFVTLLRQRRPAVVCSILIHANILATLARSFAPRARYVQSIHTLQPRPRWHWWAQGIVVRAADGFVTPSQAILDRTCEFGPLPKKSAAIPNGIDVVRFRDALPWPPQSPTEGIESLPTMPPGPWMGYVGRFDPVKNLPALIDAYSMYIQELKQQSSVLIPSLVLVGYGPEEGRLRQQVRRLGMGERVFFAGPTSSPERWYKSFVCTVLPSDVEGYGLTVAESLAAGVPVMAVESPAIREIVGKSYPLCTSAAPESLLWGLREVMCDGKMWITESCRAEAICDIQMMAQFYNNFFKIFYPSQHI